MVLTEFVDEVRYWTGQGDTVEVVEVPYCDSLGLWRMKLRVSSVPFVLGFVHHGGTIPCDWAYDEDTLPRWQALRPEGDYS